MKTTIIGLGCDILGDYGIGIFAAKEISKIELGHHIQSISVGNAILDNIDYFFCTDLLIIIDAMHGDNYPGHVYKFIIDKNDKYKFINTKHGFNLSCLAQLAEKNTYPEIIVYGIEPERWEWSTSISETLMKTVDNVIDMIAVDISKIYK